MLVSDVEKGFISSGVNLAENGNSRSLTLPPCNMYLYPSGIAQVLNLLTKTKHIMPETETPLFVTYILTGEEKGSPS